MRIAVLSGKGGTGKTLLAVNLAAVASESVYIDCDVEEPNGHLFFRPQKIREDKVTVRIPLVDKQLCAGCRGCVDFCKFNALAYIQDSLLVFPELCHSCGGCVLLCPEKALREQERIIGEIHIGVSENVTVITGILNTGEASGVPIIKEALNLYPGQGATFIDCPPGSSCTVMESIKEADYCILVAEPTLFGRHNLEMVYELVKLFNKPHGVILNKYLKYLAGENPAEEFCREKNIRILGRIPFNPHLGTLNADALVLARAVKKYRDMFTDLWQCVTKEVEYAATPNT